VDSSGSTGLAVSLAPAEPGVTLIALDGEVDLASVSAFTAALNRAVAETDDCVVVDMAGLTFCDAAGLGALAVAHSALARRGRLLTVVNARGQRRRMLALLGMSSLLSDECGGAGSQPERCGHHDG
jgi:anti-anti-sigma factor